MILHLIIALLAFYAALHAAPLRLATYNVHNYLSADRRVDETARRAYPKPEEEKKALRAVILSVRPDVLALQEIGSLEHLNELADDLSSASLNYPFRIIGEGADPERRTALLSRLEPVEVINHHPIAFSYLGDRTEVKRGLIEAQFQTGVHAWKVFVVHLKSRITEVPDDPKSRMQRELEATAIRDLIRKKRASDPDALFFVLGDFNDTRASKPLERFLSVGRTHPTVLLETADSRNETWTFHYRYEDTYDRIDFILPSQAAFKRVCDGRAYICDVPESTLASDHRLVWLDWSPEP